LHSITTTMINRPVRSCNGKRNCATLFFKLDQLDILLIHHTFHIYCPLMRLYNLSKGSSYMLHIQEMASFQNWKSQQATSWPIVICSSFIHPFSKTTLESIWMYMLHIWRMRTYINMLIVVILQSVYTCPLGQLFNTITCKPQVDQLGSVKIEPPWIHKLCTSKALMLISKTERDLQSKNNRVLMYSIVWFSARCFQTFVLWATQLKLLWKTFKVGA